MVNIKLFLSTLMLLVFISCQEQVSDDLPSKKDSSDATETSTDVDTSGTPSIYTFKLEHDMDENLSFHLHQTGSGNGNTPCTINSTSAFTSQSPQTIDCILDVEELDLYSAGAKLTMTGSNYACEYLGYVPYSYYRYPIGKTLKYKFNHVCDEACTDSFTDDEYCPTDNYEPTCDYDHSASNSAAPNCDLGGIVTVTLNYEGGTCDVFGDGDFEATPSSVDVEATSYQACGGEVFNCLGGAATEQVDKDTDWITISNDSLEEVTYSITMSPPQDELKNASIDIANFMGMCYDSTAANDASYFLDNGVDWDDAANNYRSLSTYDIGRMENYGFEKAITGTFDNGDFTLLNDAEDSKYFGTADAQAGTENHFYISGTNYIVLDNALVRQQILSDYGAYFDATGNYYLGKDTSGDFSGILGSIPITADPFRAPENAGIRYAYPYYYFLCLDKSFDIKAKITLMIREWDLEFSTSYEHLDKLSDHFEDDSLMDRHPNNSNDSETGGIPGITVWNDQLDWDDFLMNFDTGLDDTVPLLENDCDSFSNQIDRSTSATNSTFPHRNNFPGCKALYDGEGCF